jgi:hypothetical protein
MSKSRNQRLGMYADLQPILDAALASGGGSYTLPTYGQAVHWRQRAYAFRKLYAETMHTTSKYDALTLPRIAEGSGTVLINLAVPKGVFQPHGEAIDPSRACAYEDSPDLLDLAEQFAKKLEK